MMTELRRTLSIGIYIKGHILNPQTITEILNIVPTESFRKGQIHTTVANRMVTRKTGLWAIVSDVQSQLIEDHFSQLDNVFVRLREKQAELQQLSDIDEAFIDFFICALSTNLSKPVEFSFSAIQTGIIHETGLPIRFSVGSAKP